jgi:hypothetical protein
MVCGKVFHSHSKTEGNAMRKRIISAITLVVLITAFFLQLADLHAADSTTNDIKPLQHYVDIGRLPSGIKKQLDESAKVDVIITLDEGEAQEKAAQMREALGRKIDNDEIIAEKARIYKNKKSRVLSGITMQDYKVLEDYDKLPILYIEVNENALTRLLQIPEVVQIGENNKSVTFLSQSLPLIRAPQAHSAGARGAGTSVAVLDTGVNYTLSAFGNCTAPGVPASTCKVALAYDFAPNDGYLDDDGHGTNVSGILVGVAPDTKLLVLDVFTLVAGKQWAYDNHLLSALNWVLTYKSIYNIQAVNMSLGGLQYTSPCAFDSLASAVYNLKVAGVATVIASGNDGYTSGIARPACIPSAISVGAVYDSNVGGRSYLPCTDYSTATDMVTCFSNSAYFLTMLAPGAVISAAGYNYSGTSQATPHVAGAVAAIKSINPNLTVDGVINRLTSTGVSVTDWRNGIVKPRIDLFASLSSPCSVPQQLNCGLFVNFANFTCIYYQWHSFLPPYSQPGSYPFTVQNGAYFFDYSCDTGDYFGQLRCENGVVKNYYEDTYNGPGVVTCH